MSHSAIRSVLLAVLVVGAIGGVGPGTTYGLFTDTHTDTATMSAADNFNSNGNGNGDGPTADAGGPYIVSEGESVKLDGSSSTAQTGNLDSGDYDWRIDTSAGDDDSLSSNTGPQVTYNAPTTVSDDTTAGVELTVTNDGQSDTDTAAVTVSDGDGCGTTTLAFCTDDIIDRDTSYSVLYEVGDPNGGFSSVNVTLEKSNNNQERDTASSTSIADTLTVSDGNNMNNEYTIRVELYNASGGVVECREAIGDPSDGTNPTVSDCEK